MKCFSFQLENGESIISVTSELAMKSFEKPLFSADLQIISDMIKQALYLSANSMENFLDTWHRYRVLRELLQVRQYIYLLVLP